MCVIPISLYALVLIRIKSKDRHVSQLMSLRENLQETNQSMDCFQENIGNMFSLILRKYSFHYFRKQ